ncbi:MAG: rhomboid family intramembrane serine protease [Solirubrobacteraceae bacterium]|jgi:membrane associated rhomboid family serine protease
MSTIRNLPERRREPAQGLVLLAGIVLVMWVVEAINALDGGGLDRGGGILPRNLDHIWAIFTAPFLHANFYPHLVDNTIPLVFMGVFIAVKGAARLARVTLIVIVIGGLGTWLISPGNSDTFGASGLVFGYATYLFARGLFDRNWIEILIGVIVGVVWGSALVSSLVPHTGISWQGHASGAVGGVVAAWLLAGRRQAGARGPGAASAVPPEHAAAHESLDRFLAQ